MKTSGKMFARGAELIAATMLAAIFATFLFQIFMRFFFTPVGWTVELIQILWVWAVFFGAAFVVRERDHVTFDILYLSTPYRVRQILALISALAVVIAMLWAFLPTWDYIDWMKIRKTTTVREPIWGQKIPLRTIFSIYAIFMLAIIARYAWRFIDVLRNGPPDEDHEIPGHEADDTALKHGDDVV